MPMAAFADLGGACAAATSNGLCSRCPWPHMPEFRFDVVSCGAAEEATRPSKGAALDAHGRICRSSGLTSFRAARRKLRRNQFDHEPRSKHDQNPGKATNAHGRRLSRLQPGDRGLTEATTARKGVLAPRNSEARGADRASDLGEGIELHRAIALHGVGHVHMKAARAHPRLTALFPPASPRLCSHWHHDHNPCPTPPARTPRLECQRPTDLPTPSSYTIAIATR
jgi:hypothetical protein